MKSAGPVAIGFDIGGSKTKVGLVSANGEIIACSVIPTSLVEQSPGTLIEKLFEEILRFLHQSDQPVAGIGGTFLGWIDDNRTGPFLCQNAPALHGLNLKEMLEREFHLPVVLKDDANAHALAEYTYGCGQGVRRFMNVALGTGIGIGFLLRGKALDFTSGCIGDAGHMILRPGGPTCSAGCKGCSEALIGVAGIERLGSARYGQRKTAHEIIDRARAGDDPIASEIMREVGHYTGEMLASISHIFLPDRIALTGGTARSGPVLLEAAKERFEELVGDYHRTYTALSGGYYPGVEIIYGNLQGETGVIGAVVELLASSDQAR
jgi:glucokinase